MSGSRSRPPASGVGAARLAGALASWLAARGFDLCAALAPERYDARVPEAWRTSRVLPGAAAVQVLGASGAALWRALRAAPEWERGGDPVDRYTERIGAEACTWLRDAGGEARAMFAHEAHGGAHADFVALATEAGLGGPSRLGLLLHPERGPWWSLRALLVTDLPLPPGTPLAGFAPCLGCAAPCAEACHGEAVLPEGFSVSHCGAARARVPACRTRCDARHACVLGPAHAYDAAAEAHHMTLAGVPPTAVRPRTDR